MDAVKELVTNSQNPAAILGNESGFLLAYLDGQQISESDRAIANLRGYYFAGAVGLIGGKVEIAPEPFLECKLIVLVAALEYANRLTASKGESVSWLERLMLLPDTRNDVGPA